MFVTQIDQFSDLVQNPAIKLKSAGTLSCHTIILVATGTSAKNWSSVSSKKLRYNLPVSLAGKLTVLMNDQSPIIPTQIFNENLCWKQFSHTLCIFSSTITRSLRKFLDKVARSLRGKLCEELRIWHNAISAGNSAGSRAWTWYWYNKLPFRIYETI